MHDIETLITHFLSVSWGPVMPPGEALGAIEATKGTTATTWSATAAHFLPHAHSHAFVRAHADAAAVVPRPDDPGFAGDFGQPGFCAGGH